MQSNITIFIQSIFKININFLSECSIPEETIMRIDPIVGRQVLFICKEIMTNAAKHATCDEVKLQLAFIEGFIVLRITDNGCGFDLIQVQKRGLNNMLRRSEKYKIGLDIDTNKQGSVFTLKIPLPTQMW